MQVEITRRQCDNASVERESETADGYEAYELRAPIFEAMVLKRKTYGQGIGNGGARKKRQRRCRRIAKFQEADKAPQKQNIDGQGAN